MKNTNEETTRLKKYEDLRKEIQENNDSVKEKGYKTDTVTIPINNNYSLDTSSIESKNEKNSKEAKVFRHYKFKKALTICGYGLIALAIIAVVILVIVLISKN